MSRPVAICVCALVLVLAVLYVHHNHRHPARAERCQCPAGRYTRTHDGTVLRHMRPTLSELGVYDGTALMEFKTRKHIVYLLNRENTCTYEMDDTPPFPVNQAAVDVAIEQCLMLGCDIVDEVHIARKQYLDGSIPTGFQRTAIVGVNGKLPFRGRTLSITQVSVEEEIGSAPAIARAVVVSSSSASRVRVPKSKRMRAICIFQSARRLAYICLASR